MGSFRENFGFSMSDLYNIIDKSPKSYVCQLTCQHYRSAITKQTLIS